MASKKNVGRVLIIDDDIDIQQTLEEWFQAQGFQVRTAANGREGLQTIQKSIFHLVILDLNMPEMDGLKAARAIRKLSGVRGRVPIVGITGNSATITERKCRDAGMDDYLQKPIGIDAYKKALAKWVAEPEA